MKDFDKLCPCLWWVVQANAMSENLEAISQKLSQLNARHLLPLHKPRACRMRQTAMKSSALCLATICVKPSAEFLVQTHEVAMRTGQQYRLHPAALQAASPSHRATARPRHDGVGHCNCVACDSVHFFYDWGC